MNWRVYENGLVDSMALDTCIKCLLRFSWTAVNLVSLSSMLLNCRRLASATASGGTAPHENRSVSNPFVKDAEGPSMLKGLAEIVADLQMEIEKS